MNNEQAKILSEILIERDRQDSKFGEQTRPPEDYLMILGEEVGEANKAALEHKLCGKDPIFYREEMIQVAAVAIAAIESFDRLNPQS
jgi:NTP pyrophosphatase (non-canonical NTP hydrolase)